MDFERLLSPIELRGKRVRNRVTLTAHTQSYSDGGIHGARVRGYYAARAAGGAGLLVMEPIPPHPTGRVTPQNYDHTKPGFVEGLRTVVDAVHEHGGTIINQLYHMGPNADPLATGGQQWGPSDAPGYFGVGRIHAMTTDEIDLITRCFAECAETVMRSGTDGVELMFSYDTLVDSFLYDDRNTRTDRYGGSFENKARFAVGILLILVFSVTLGWLPAFGRGEVVQLGWWSTGLLTPTGRMALVLPGITLSLFQITLVMRLVRAEMLETLRTDFIRFARARGLRAWAVNVRHALRNCLMPVITVTGLQIGNLIAFALVTETVFQWPGMGLLFVQAVTFVDIPVMAAYLMLVSFVFVTLNTLVDLAYGIVDPRLRQDSVKHG